MIGREKEQEILKFMAERPFPPKDAASTSSGLI
jgi:hypothetical protein